MKDTPSNLLHALALIFVCGGCVASDSCVGPALTRGEAEAEAEAVPSPQPPATKAAEPALEGVLGERARALVRASTFADQAALIESRLRPSVRILPTRSTQEAIPLGASRFAGLPDLPEGLAWPKREEHPMALLAQINLKDLAGRAPPGKLPATGWLYFFYSMEASTWGYDPKDADSFAVLYHDGPLESLTRAAIPTGYGEAARSFSPSALSFTAAVDLPDPEDRRFPTELLSPGENEKYDAWYALNAAVRDFDENRSPGHQLFGHPMMIQGPMREECELVSKGTYTGRGYVPLPETEDAQARIDAWNLLLQLDSDRSGPGWMWGDMGRIYLWIRDEDLAARRFDRSWMHLYCY